MAGERAWLSKLRAGRREAEEAANMTGLRSVARRFTIDCRSKELDVARAAVFKRLDELIATQEAMLAKLATPATSSLSQGSTASRRSSVSSAPRAVSSQPFAAAEQAAHPQGSPCTTPTSSQPLLQSSGPTAPARFRPALPASAASPAAKAEEEEAAGPLTQLLLGSRVQVVEEENQTLKLKVESLEEALAHTKEQLAQAKDGNRKLLEQARTTQAGQLRMESRMEAMELQMTELMAANAVHMQTRDSVSLLHSEQQHLQVQQQLGECKQCIVFKGNDPLPTEGTAAHLQGVLSEQLGVQVTVQSVKQLGRQPAPSEEGPEQRPTAYKVVLGSSGERIEVLRVKAKALKGKPMSIGPFLTPDQLALEKRLRPVARQAKAAGKHVRWQYGGLLIDGKPYTGVGSLPTPAKRGHGGLSAASAAQAASKRALFSTVGGSFAPLLQSSKNAAKPKGNSNTAAKQEAKGGGSATANRGSGSAATKQKAKGGGAAAANQGSSSTAAKQKAKGSDAAAANQGSGSAAAKQKAKDGGSVAADQGSGSAAANRGSGSAASKKGKGCGSPPAHQQGKCEIKALSPAKPPEGASSAVAQPLGAGPTSSSEAPASPSSPARA